MRYKYIATENGNVVCEGGVSEVAEMLGTAICTLKEHAKSDKPLIKTNITISREIKPKTIRVIPKKIVNVEKPPKFEDYGIEMLRRYGNTVSKKEPSEYLKRMGMNCKVTKKGSKRDSYYLIEVIYD